MSARHTAGASRFSVICEARRWTCKRAMCAWGDTPYAWRVLCNRPRPRFVRPRTRRRHARRRCRRPDGLPFRPRPSTQPNVSNATCAHQRSPPQPIRGAVDDGKRKRRSWTRAASPGKLQRPCTRGHSWWACRQTRRCHVVRRAAWRRGRLILLVKIYVGMARGGAECCVSNVWRIPRTPHGTHVRIRRVIATAMDPVTCVPGAGGA